MTSDGVATRRPGALPGLTLLELWSAALALLSLACLYASGAVARATGPQFTTDPAANVWIFYPHVLLLALIVGGLRRSAVIVQTFIVLFALLTGLSVWVGSAMGGHSTDGIGLLVACQVVLFVLTYRSAKRPRAWNELPNLGPRLALGALVGAAGWLGAGTAAMRATAPARAQVEYVAAGKRQAAARRDARNVIGTIGSCLQRVPVSADSEPIYPATLGELAADACPEAVQPPPAGFGVEYAPGAPDSSGQIRSFTLTMREEPASDTSYAYEVDQLMTVREWRGQDRGLATSAGRDMLNAMAAIGRCIEHARTAPAATGDSVYPRSTAELALRSECGLHVTPDSSTARLQSGAGYILVHYAPPSSPRRRGAFGGYTLSVEPARDSLGRTAAAWPLSFFSDTNGSIHMTRRARAATVADPVLHDCRQGGQRVALARGELCREYLPRQRWGADSSIPTIGWSMSGAGTLGIGETLYFIPQYQPVVAADSAVEVEVWWDVNGPDSTMRRRHGVPFGEPMGNGVNFRFEHAYPDTGAKIIRFEVRTGAGEKYEIRDTVRVVGKR